MCQLCYDAYQLAAESSPSALNQLSGYNSSSLGSSLGSLGLIKADSSALVNAFLLGFSVTGDEGFGSKITYVVNSNLDTSATQFLGSNPLNDGIDAAFAAWNTVANVGFEKKLPSVFDSGLNSSRDIVITVGALDAETLGQASPSFATNNPDQSVQTFITLNSLYFGTQSVQALPGTEGFSTILHEIGHGLGLAHPDVAEGGSVFGVTLNESLVSLDTTIMNSTALQSGVFVDGAVITPITPMLFDILAIQYLYGANTTYNLGDTSYTFNGVNVAQTQWDAGGIDTLDQSATTFDVKLDIREGYTNVAGSDGTIDFVNIIGSNIVWFAFGANIENILAGSGNDTVRGNDLGNYIAGNSGNDEIFGFAGVDIINGNAGSDVVNGNAGNDYIRGGRGDDIMRGGQGDDIIFGDLGNDVIFGDLGNDTIYSGSGSDLIFGGGGADLFTLYAGDEFSLVFDFNSAEGDRLGVSSVLASSSAVVLASAISVGSDTQITIGGDSILLQGASILTDADIIII